MDAYSCYLLGLVFFKSILITEPTKVPIIAHKAALTTTINNRVSACGIPRALQSLTVGSTITKYARKRRWPSTLCSGKVKKALRRKIVVVINAAKPPAII